MSRRLTFNFDVDKFVNAAAYLVERCPEVTKMKLFKLLYYADKEHLLTYGRPIIGDRYIKMEWGPVPSRGYNIVKHDDRASSEESELFDGYIGVQGKDLFVKTTPNLDYLSESDIEALDATIQRYGRLTACQLSNLSHREAAWSKAEPSADLDYRLFFANRPDADEVKNLAQDDQELRDALNDVEFEEFLAAL